MVLHINVTHLRQHFPMTAVSTPTGVNIKSSSYLLTHFQNCHQAGQTYAYDCFLPAGPPSALVTTVLEWHQRTVSIRSEILPSSCTKDENFLPCPVYVELEDAVTLQIFLSSHQNTLFCCTTCTKINKCLAIRNSQDL